MKKRRLFSKVAAWAMVISLAVSPDLAAACQAIPLLVHTDHMRQKCDEALTNPKKFLRKVKAGAINGSALSEYILAFDDGSYGCRKDQKFTFRILDSFYSKPERLYSEPSLLRRYYYSWPAQQAEARKGYISNLIWLFSDYATDLRIGWSAEQAREFVSKPEHFSIALKRFGTALHRDKAVFAIVSDPKSPHFDRDTTVRLAEQSLQDKVQRRLTAAALLVDPALGQTDFAKAEMLLPLSGLYDDSDWNPQTVSARALWGKIAEHYAQSGDAALREKGRTIREKMAPPKHVLWPPIELPKDGGIWLSLADWPKAVPNPFGSPKFETMFTAADYPSSSLRTEEAGAVTIAAKFGPDGRFSGLEVMQSSGSPALDTETVRIIGRRYRPKLDDMVLSGYPGKEVRVPMVIVDWQFFDGNGSSSGITRFADGRLTVLAEIRDRDFELYPCGPPPSIFL